MLEISEAVEILLQHINMCSETKEIDIENAVGYITASDVKAPICVPHFPKSAMDGYAVSSEDVKGASDVKPVQLEVVEEMLAGDYKELTYRKNTAVRVMTGAYIPLGYDCVVRQEDTDYGMDNVNIYKAVCAYQNYCKIGEDIVENETVIKANTKLTSLHIGILASLGIKTVFVKRPLKVAIVSTGTELIEPGQVVLPGKIYNSISYILSSKINYQKLEVIERKNCSDDIGELSKLLVELSERADVIITTGGVSVGKKDILPDTMDKIGAKKLFKGLNIQPGTPTMASEYKGKIILSLSGNPYAALANFELFFWEIVAKYMDNSLFLNQEKYAILDSEYNKMSKRRRLIRAYEENGRVTIPDNIHTSSVISNMTGCNCFIDVKEDTVINLGDTVKIIKFNQN